MKSVSQTLLERRSIRRYEYDPVTDDQIKFIHEAIRNTPTSYNGQTFSVVDVSDPEVKQQIYDITGQKQVKTCSHFLLFLADYHKIDVAARLKGLPATEFPTTLDGVFVGVIDATLALMSALVAAESMGLGTCCIGYARTADPEAMVRVLHLPEHTFVVCGLAIGVPREMPDLKPKQPTSLTIHPNHYSDDNIAGEIEAYDREVTEYNATRAGSKSTNDWTSHILDYMREGMHYHMLESIRRQGFDVIR